MAPSRLSILILSAVIVLLSMVESVDKNNFKTCEQSSFCRRLRKMSPGESKYQLDIDSVSVDKDTLTALLVNNDYGVKFVLKLKALADSTFRLLVDEKEPLAPRYRVEYALKGEPVGDAMTLLETNAEQGSIRVRNSFGHLVVLNTKPFKIDFYDLKGGLAAVINDRGLMAIEHLRTKTEKKEDGAEGDENIQELTAHEDMDPGAWEENYKSHHDTKPRGPEALSLDITFPKAANLYGIPEHADSFALKSTKNQDPYRLYNLDVFEYELDSTMALYGAVPVLYAHGQERTVGAFWLNAAETWVDIDDGKSGDVVSSIVSFVSGNSNKNNERVSARFMSESGVLELFIMMGPTPAEVFTQYTQLTGVAPTPPLFSLAYHQCRWNYNDEEDVRAVDANFDLHDIPMDVMWLDIEYTDQKKYFTWDSSKFAHPTEMITNLTAKGRKMVLIIDPHIKREAGYFLHDEATDNNYYVKNKDNKDYEGWCWPGSSSYLDFYAPRVREYYSKQYNLDRFQGTSNDVHIWNDMNEPSVFNGPEVTMPKDCMHYGDWEHRHVHNTYGLVHTMATHEGLLARSGGTLRPFILTRSHFAGSQRYAAVWTGDNSAEWPFLRATIPMCLSLGVAGISFCGSDVGGFFKYPEAELMTRWYQAAAFQPFFRAHSHIDTKRREPWLYDPATTGLIRDAIRRRYSYLPLWYTLFHEHSVSGLPVMRPLFMLFPQEKSIYTIDNEYMIGDALLVRPVMDEGATSVNIVLPGPPGQLWYDVDTYQPMGPSSFDLQVNIAKIPVYQRGGSIVPKKERMRRASSLMTHDPFTLVVTLASNFTAEGSLYIDDGETFEYQKGKYIYAKIKFAANVLSYSFPNKGAKYSTKSWLERVVIAGIKTPPKRAELQVAGSSPVVLALTYHTGNDVLVIRKPEVSMGVEWKIIFEN